MTKLFPESSNHATTAHRDLSIRASTVQAAVESVYCGTVNDVNSMKDQIQSFSGDETRDVNLTQGEIESFVQHQLRVDGSTGSTPVLQEYKYRQTWGRTRPSQDLLNEFRGRDQVDMFTANQHLKSRAQDIHPSSPSERCDTEFPPTWS
ncbi:MAG: hypothetical protein J3Q66DRAFT_364647 [Benniella sp.]|nr:MAG: hypothetical protein J3Q66DRAFT_364647 [Benniella sp.]